MKRRNFLTRWHCDAFSTVFERKLLRESNLDFELDKREVERFKRLEKTGEIVCSWEEIPIYTFWISLRDLPSLKASHLRLHPNSHAMKNQKLNEELRNVVPEGYKYQKRDFIGPKGGYKQGDLVVFHCLTQHEANAHDGLLKQKSQERISMDGRFFLRLQ